MKRKNEIDKSQESKREKTLGVAIPLNDSREVEGVGGDHLAWNIIISKLDYQSQMKMSQQNKRLAEVVQMNAESDLRKFRRQIQENKFM